MVVSDSVKPYVQKEIHDTGEVNLLPGCFVNQMVTSRQQNEWGVRWFCFGLDWCELCCVKDCYCGNMFIYVLLKYFQWLKCDSLERMPAIVWNDIVYKI